MACDCLRRLVDMPTDLAAILPTLLPRAIEWATAHSNEVQQDGEPLSVAGMKLAAVVGVLRPERIRVKVVSSLPLPDDPELRRAALDTGLLGPGMIGLTLGYGIYVCEGHIDDRLMSHECRHVQQYEAAGSIARFLPVYLQQIADYGYHDAPHEVDAREHEISA